MEYGRERRGGRETMIYYPKNIRKVSIKNETKTWSEITIREASMGVAVKLEPLSKGSWDLELGNKTRSSR